jgi:arginyl-tRNA synthetase
VKSIFRKAGEDMASYQARVNVASKQEHDLVVKMMQFDEVLEAVSKEATPHLLCAYLYEVASLFMRFYEANPILKSDVEAEVKQSRLALASLCARTLETGLSLLGISTLEAM